MKRLVLTFAIAALTIFRVTPTHGADPAAATADKPAIYNESADAKADVKAAELRAAKENKRVLLQIGGNWCGWCVKLHELCQSNKEIRALLNAEYEVVHVNYSPGHENKEFFAAYKIVPKGYPYLAVLDPGDHLLTQQETGVLEDGPKHDPQKVKAFLEKWKAPPLDAQQVLSDALARAGSEDKLVFLHFGAPWCGWCHRLEDVLSEPAVESALQNNLVSVKIDIDRMTGGKQIQAKYQTHSAGIPWYAILKPDGQVVGISERPGTQNNIGFPSEPAEIDYVVKLLTQSGKPLSEEQVTVVRDAFTKAAAKVKHP